MLKNADLRAFVAYAATQITEIKDTKLLANDSRFSRISKDVVDEQGRVALFTIIPSATAIANNEDNLRFSTALSFLIFKKFTTGDGEEHYNNVFDITQAVALKLVKLVQEYKQQKHEPCLLEDIDLNSLTIIPIENYHQTNGYDVSFRLKTDFKV